MVQVHYRLMIVSQMVQTFRDPQKQHPTIQQSEFRCHIIRAVTVDVLFILGYCLLIQAQVSAKQRRFMQHLMMRIQLCVGR